MPAVVIISTSPSIPIYIHGYLVVHGLLRSIIWDMLILATFETLLDHGKGSHVQIIRDIHIIDKNAYVLSSNDSHSSDY